MKKKNVDTKKLVCLAVLISLDVIFSRLLVIRLGIISIRFSFVAVVFAALKYGSVNSAIVAGTSDFMGALFFNTKGFYFPGFTLSALLMGLVTGFFLNKTCNIKRIILSVVCVQIPLSLFLNTYWMSLVMGRAFVFLFPRRLLQCVIMIIIEIFTIEYLFVKKRLHEVIPL